MPDASDKLTENFLPIFAPSNALPASTAEPNDGRRASSGGRSFLTGLVTAKPSDAKFVSHLQKKFSNCLGFLPTPALQWYIENRRVGLALENGEPCGYVLGRESYRFERRMRPITQAAVAMDAQRRHHGIALVNRICDHALGAGQVAVQACCASDLDANDFWLLAGFEPITELEPTNARGRKIIVWRKKLYEAYPEFFYQPPPAAGHRARRTGK